MKISYNWLKDFVDVQKTPEELADDLSLFGFEVEGIEKVGDDTVLDLEITPNRGDCLSILGIAREVAGLYNLKLKAQSLKLQQKTENIDKDINIQISGPEICPRFTARIVDNIKIKESPKWLQKRLESYGFRPLNNIVDIINYVMIATGQPLHAFDYNKIKDGLMNIRLSKKGEEVMTLDGKNHILPDKAIIIEDKEKIFDLAGIMGGIKSEVDNKTKTIILQGAIFDPILIRRASKYLKHITDASYRYERGVDYEGTIIGVDLAADLIKKSCSDTKIGELIDIVSVKPSSIIINIDIKKVNNLLGTDVTEKEAFSYLQRLNFQIQIDDHNVIVPSYRVYDVKIWPDLAEEIARVYGYNKINKQQLTNTNNQQKDTDWQEREIIKDILKEIGFTEVYSYSFADKDKMKILGENISDCLETANPIAPELKYLRPSLLPSLLGQIAKNPWAPEVNVFEIEKVFKKNTESWQLGLISVGKNEKMILKALQGLNLQVKIENVDKSILDAYKIRRPVKYIIVDIEDIKDVDDLKDLDNVNDKSSRKYKPISKYPPTIRDLAFIVDDNVNINDIIDTIKAISDNILLVECFDEFSSKIFGNNKKNVAFHIWFQDMEKPVKDNEANEIINKIIKEIEIKYKAKLRSK